MPANDATLAKWSEVEGYIKTGAERFENELKDLIRIPSVSAQPAHNADTRKAAEFVRDDLTRSGIAAEIVETAGHPIVVGRSPKIEGQPTVLVYGHYDVQPAEKADGWATEPFEPVEKNGNLYARGATDDKGQFFTHLKAAEAWMKAAGGLPVNVIFLIEGEEEVGGANLEKFFAEKSHEFACDYAVISDSSQWAPGIPAVTYGLRGLCYLELLVQGPKTDLHSGMFGGAVVNPLNALCQIIASLHDDQGRVAIEGFYEDVTPLEDWERAEFAALPFDENAFREGLGVKELSGEAGYTTLERKSARPTCDVHGLWGGYAGPGPKTVLPAKAGAKLSFRLVPNQDNRKIAALFRDHVAKVCPKGVTFEIIDHHGAPGVVVRTDTPGMAAARRAIEVAFGREPVLVREGGSIPVVGLIKDHLKVDTLLLGWGQNDDNLHGPDEKFSLADFHRGIAASARFFAELAK
jgi:acetylornithine deacetylase/succinyl-diaminopimelate desuccinylase-like protein